MAVMTLAAYLTSGLNLFGISPLLPLAIEEYGISRFEAGLLISMPMLMGAVLGIPGGMLAARIGIKRSFMISWVCMGLLVLSALTPNYYVLLVLRLLYGVGLSMSVAASGPLVMQWFRSREVLAINAANTAILSLGVAASVAAAVPLAEILGWKTSLTVLSGLGVLGAVIWPLAPADLKSGRGEPAAHFRAGCRRRATRPGRGAAADWGRGSYRAVHGVDWLAAHILQ